MGKYLDHYNTLARDMLRFLAHEQEGKNVVCSPASFVSMMLVALLSTRGKSHEEIKRFLCGDLYEGMLRRWFLDTMQDPDQALHSADAVVIKETLKDAIVPGYTDTLRMMYGAELFATPNIVADVNAWVNKQTKGMIDKLLNEKDNLDFGLMNALAFDAPWEKPYEDDQIESEEFHNADGTKVEVTMLGSEESDYIETKEFTGVVKPYKGRRYAFMALLPKDEKGSLVPDSLDFSELYKNRIEDWKVIADIPEFKADFTQELKDFCQDFGIQEIFKKNSDFSPMLNVPVEITSVRHKAVIDVSRQGTKAAAVSIMAGMVMGMPRFVTLDRPFVYAIMDTKHKLPVFVGVQRQF